MDAGLLRGLFTVLMMVIFVGIFVWAWSKKRVKRFEDAANLPFADEQLAQRSAEDAKRKGS